MDDPTPYEDGPRGRRRSVPDPVVAALCGRVAHREVSDFGNAGLDVCRGLDEIAGDDRAARRRGARVVVRLLRRRKALGDPHAADAAWPATADLGPIDVGAADIVDQLGLPLRTEHIIADDLPIVVDVAEPRHVAGRSVASDDLRRPVVHPAFVNRDGDVRRTHRRDGANVRPAAMVRHVKADLRRRTDVGAGPRVHVVVGLRQRRVARQRRQQAVRDRRQRVPGPDGIALRVGRTLDRPIDADGLADGWRAGHDRPIDDRSVERLRRGHVLRHDPITVPHHRLMELAGRAAALVQHLAQPEGVRIDALPAPHGGIWRPADHDPMRAVPFDVDGAAVGLEEHVRQERADQARHVRARRREVIALGDDVARVACHDDRRAALVVREVELAPARDRPGWQADDRRLRRVDALDQRSALCGSEDDRFRRRGGGEGGEKREDCEDDPHDHGANGTITAVNVAVTAAVDPTLTYMIGALNDSVLVFTVDTF